MIDGTYTVKAMETNYTEKHIVFFLTSVCRNQNNSRGHVKDDTKRNERCKTNSHILINQA